MCAQTIRQIRKVTALVFDNYIIMANRTIRLLCNYYSTLTTKWNGTVNFVSHPREITASCLDNLH
jgi:hypothetical protein